MKPLLISSGEPAGIGPDLCLALAAYDLPIVVLGDLNLLKARANELKLSIQWVEYNSKLPVETKPGYLTVFSIPCEHPVTTGQLNPKNAAYVMNLLTTSASLCTHFKKERSLDEATTESRPTPSQKEEFSALITAPVHKANINAGGFTFTGHTEFFAQYFEVETVVMMLACEDLRVALVTTHLPLSQVPQSISYDLIIKVITQLNQSLKDDFGISNPQIKVAGLNPHAGESGYLGREEIEIINPALEFLRAQGIKAEGPLPADTLFTQSNCDAFVAMYHDQGLPVLKYAGFNKAVNVTLGLPIIRTSVDHGTALDLAGKGLADSGSMLAAVKMAAEMVKNRIK